MAYIHITTATVKVFQQIEHFHGAKSHPCCPTVTAPRHRAKWEHLELWSPEGSWGCTTAPGSDLCSPRGFNWYRIYPRILAEK